MTAIFYNSDVVTEQAPPSDLIIPISARQGANDSVSQFTLPAQNATNTISFPRNVRRAVFSVSANGQSTEEFWWSNVLQKDVWTFNDTAGEYPGYSPFREVQVLIDGQLAGVQWPFPVIFTGGVVPSLHRPIVGINAFDLREHEIDITPFLPLLCDGAQHTFTIRVAGINDTPRVALTETVNESWYVTGKIFVWLDEDPSSITTGHPPHYPRPATHHRHPQRHYHHRKRHQRNPLLHHLRPPHPPHLHPPPQNPTFHLPRHLDPIPHLHQRRRPHRLRLQPSQRPPHLRRGHLPLVFIIPTLQKQ